MQNFLDEVVNSKKGKLGGQGYIGFIDPGKIDCDQATLYINSTGDINGGPAGHFSFRGAGRRASRIQNAALSIGDIAGVINGKGPSGSAIFLSSFDLYGYLDYWSPQSGTIIDRLTIVNPDTQFPRAYSSGTSSPLSGSSIDASLCNIYTALQFFMFGIAFQAGAPKGGSAPSMNAVRANVFNNLCWLGGGCLADVDDPNPDLTDGGEIGFLIDQIGLPREQNAGGEMLTLRELHFEGQRQESIYLKSVRNAEIKVDARPHANHDSNHAVIQIGDRGGLTPLPPTAVTVHGCYAVSDSGRDTFLQAKNTNGLVIKENYVNGFATRFALASDVTAYTVDPTNQFLPYVSSLGGGTAFALQGVVFPGSISTTTTGGVPTTTMSATGVVSNALAGRVVNGPGVAVGTLITASGTTVYAGLPGEYHTFPLNIPQAVASATLVALPTSAVIEASFVGTSMTVRDVVFGSLAVGQNISGSGVVSGSTIVSQSTGYPGGPGGYTLNSAQTLSPTVSETVLASTDSIAGIASGFISGGSLVIDTPLPGGGFHSGQIVFAAGVADGTVIVSGPGGGGASAPYSVGTPQTDLPIAGAFTGVLNGTLMTASTPTSGSLLSNQWVVGTDVPLQTKIVRQSSGVAGGAGLYVLNSSQPAGANVSATAEGVISGGYMTVGPPTSGMGLPGTIAAGQFVTGGGLPAGVTVLSQTTGIVGGAGVYAVSDVTDTIQPTAATAIGTITNSTMSIGNPTGGSVLAGQLVSGASVTAGTVVVSQLTGPPGLSGMYMLNSASMVAAPETLSMLGTTLTVEGASLLTTFGETMAALTTDASISGSLSGSTLNVSSVLLGSVELGQMVTGGGVAPGTFLVGPEGGGYVVNNSQTVATPAAPASFTMLPLDGVVSGGYSGSILTATVVSGFVDSGQLLFGAGVSPATTIVSVISAGTTVICTIAPAQTVASSGIQLLTLPVSAVVSGTLNGGHLTVSALIGGTVVKGQVITGPSVISGTQITGINPSGTYSINSSYATPASGVMYLSPVGAAGPGYITGTTLSLTPATTGLVAPLQVVTGAPSPAPAPGTYIISTQLGAGSYKISMSPFDFNINNSAARIYFDPIADQPINMGLITSASISIDLSGRLDYAFQLNAAGHQILFDGNGFEISASYTLIITKTHSTDSITSWGLGFLFPGGAFPTLAAMTVNQTAKITMKAVATGSPPAPALLCDCAIYGLA